MRNLILASSLAIAASGIAHTAKADDSIRSEKLQEVVVKGVRAQKNAPFAVANIKKTELNNFSKSGRELPFLFANTPGITAWSENGVGTGTTYMRIRGAAGSRINVTLDGVPLNSPEDQTVFWANMNSYGSLLKSVQIQRGIGTSTNGDGAFGGTISLLTNMPSREKMLEITGSYGTYNTYNAGASFSSGLLWNHLIFDGAYHETGTDGFIHGTSGRSGSYYGGLTWFGDKFTLRYAKYLDIDAALAWIAEEEEVGDTIPQPIKDAFPGASPSQTTIYDLKKAYVASHQELVLFADNDFCDWDYEDNENGWQPQFMNHFVMKSQTVSFCVMESEEVTMVEPIKAMCREIKAWAKGGDVKSMKNPWRDNGLYPIAYIDGNLYFMSNKERAQLNVQWGNDTMFFVRTDNPLSAAKAIDLSYKPSTKVLKLSGERYKEIHTGQLGEILQSETDGLIDEFID